MANFIDPEKAMVKAKIYLFNINGIGEDEVKNWYSWPNKGNDVNKICNEMFPRILTAYKQRVKLVIFFTNEKYPVFEGVSTEIKRLDHNGILITTK